jgi:hypothetical protein
LGGDGHALATFDHGNELGEVKKEENHQATECNITPN